MPNLFHLAIPCRDLDEAALFYARFAKVARRNDHSVIIDFFGHQLVCQLAPSECAAADVKMYPRHLGLVLDSVRTFKGIHKQMKLNGVPFFQEIRLRFNKKPEEHRTFFVRDPSNNLIEFKYYKNQEWIFSPP